MRRMARAAGSDALRARKQDFVRGAIWDAAMDLFADAGFDETTIEDIARAAGVSTRTFFRYFASKNDLMGQGMETYQALLNEAIHDAPKGCSPLQLVRHTVQKVAAEAASQPRTRHIVRIASTSVAAREAQLSRRGEVENAVARAFAAKCRTAPGDDVTPRLLAGLTLSLVDVTFRAWSTRPDTDIVPITEQVFVALTALVSDRPRAARTKQR
jgi:TetR/AcrR family transcriptional regulator, regulator of mycofactocin system